MTDRSIYEIRIQGHGGPMWDEWFAGLTVENLDDGEAVLSGPLPDQAALHGVLARLRDLGVPLLAVQRRPFEQCDTRSGATETASCHPGMRS